MGVEQCFRTRARILICLLLFVACLAVIAICIAVAVSVSAGKKESADKVTQDTGAETSKAKDEVEWPKVPDDSENVYRFASIACAEKNCSTIGVKMLAEGGSAIDAVIAVSLCLGVTRPTSSGVAGGGFMTYYNRSSGETYVLDYRETAPAAANSTMYEAGSTITSKLGGGSIGTPGEVAGLWQAHQRFGRLPWARLFEHSIQLAENGFTLNEYVARLMKNAYNKFNSELKQIFTDSDTGKMKKAGDTVKFTKLAETYRRIAEGGMETYYNGSLRDDIIADLEELDGSIVTAEDLSKYETVERPALRSLLQNGDYTMISMPPPSGGVVLQYIMHILDGYSFTKDSVSAETKDIQSTGTTYHRILEAMKFAFATREHLGDPAFIDTVELVKNMTDSEFAKMTRRKISDDTTHNVEYYGQTTDAKTTTGTSHISVLAGNGDAVAVTTSVNFVFGSKRMGRRTGMIFNNIMDDFSLPGTPAWTDDAWIAPSYQDNWIEPGKRPLSSMSPIIVINNEGNVLLVTGGSGGKKIITATVLTMINNLWLGMNLTEAVSRPRLHHQLLPPKVYYEEGFPQVYLDELRAKNHDITKVGALPVSDSVGVYDGRILGVGDFRREGVADGL